MDAKAEMAALTKRRQEIEQAILDLPTGTVEWPEAIEMFERMRDRHEHLAGLRQKRALDYYEQKEFNILLNMQYKSVLSMSPGTFADFHYKWRRGLLLLEMEKVQKAFLEISRKLRASL